MYIKSAVMVPHPPLILPEVGMGQEQAIAATIAGYREAAAQLKASEPQTIVIFSPHSVMYGDYFHISPGSSAQGSFAAFRAPQARFSVEYDAEFVAELCRRTKAAGLAAGTRGERDKALDHGTMVPLHFLKEAYGGAFPVKFVRIGLSGLPLSDHYRLGMLVKETAEALKRNTAIVGSGDLSHRLKEDGPYGFQAEGPVYDERIMAIMGKGAFGELMEFDPEFCDKAGECGHRSFTLMAGCLDGLSLKVRELSYEGPFGVGYGVCAYLPQGEDTGRHFLIAFAAAQKDRLARRKASEDEYVRLARSALERYILKGETLPVPPGLPEEMTARRAGAFVSLKKQGQLRGCIGTISASTGSIAREIIQNAISACSQDPRFDPVGPEELSELEYSVDILAPAEDIASPNELNVKRYGVIVSRGHRRGLLLPNLEGIDTVEEQIAIARRKGGIREDEPVTLQRFEVVRHY